MRQFVKNLIEIQKLSRRTTDKRENIKVCPICLQDTIDVLPNTFLGFLAPRTYVCHNCKYQGPIFAELEVEEFAKMKNTSY